MKDGYEATRIVVETLRKCGTPHMVVGALSSNAYGIPRSTKDADIVLAVNGKSLLEMAAALGPEFQIDDQASFEMVTGTLRYHLRVPSIAFAVELFLLSNDPHDQARFERRCVVRSNQIGTDLMVPTPEDVIIMKLRWAQIAKRDKDRDDVRNIIAVQGDDALDWDYIHRWCDAHGTRALLDEIRASIPPVD